MQPPKDTDDDMGIESMVAASDSLGEAAATALLIAASMSDTPLLVCMDYILHCAQDLDPEGFAFIGERWAAFSQTLPAHYDAP